jgi:hypothetical protein
LTTDRKKSGEAFWACVVVLTALAYPFSVGPAWWAWTRLGEPDWIRSCFYVIYEPLWEALYLGPDWLFQ